MQNKFESILLSILLGTSTLLGLSFWLNINYGFNLFYEKHWEELAQLQASHTPIATGFYVSVIVALLIFLIGIFVIYKTESGTKKSPTTNTINIQPEQQNIPVPQQTQVNTATEPETNADAPAPMPEIPLSRPPRLNLPKNIAQIVAQQQQIKHEVPQKQQSYSQQNPYASEITQMFSDAGYTIKQNPTISGFSPNLFAIAPDEILYIGAIDAKMDDMQRAVDKLQSVFTETLEDIQINITPFILDTMNQYQPNDSVLIFKSIDELRQFVSEHQIDEMSDVDADNFDAYSEYIDTIIQYVKNI